jgi:hypothetical protein
MDVASSAVVRRPRAPFASPFRLWMLSTQTADTRLLVSLARDRQLARAAS